MCSPSIYVIRDFKRCLFQASCLPSRTLYHQPFSSVEEFEQSNSLKKYATFLRGSLDEEHDKLRSVDLKLVSSDLPRPNLAEEDSYGGGGVKISTAGASTTAMRSK